MQVLNIFHVLVAIAMVAFILVQRGPGATAGAAFGSGASGTVFGARGAGSFLSRSTWVLAALFCLISLVMAVVVSRDLAAPQADLGVIGNAAPVEQTETVPSMDDPNSDMPVLDSDPLMDSSVDAGAEAGDMPALDAPGLDDIPGLDAAPADEAGPVSESDPGAGDSSDNGGDTGSG
ncbi:MAG: preprotein translocase subunit SecG [Xanthomonadales bacterium]|jgi:preprotein translocase subunit SecG|nr:preprotein translocase subunit SecG [Xanthomonadales bacterium]